MLHRLTKADRFWQWFEGNLERISAVLAAPAMTPEGELVLTEISDALAEYDDRIFPFGGVAPDNVKELILTADGNAEAFQAVFELARAAPTLPGWRFIPLKPRAIIEDGVYRTGEVTLDVTRLRYHISRSSPVGRAGGARAFLEPVSLLLLADEEVSEQWDQYQFLAEMFLISVLGEYEFALEIAEFAVVNRARFVERWGHDGAPISELPDEFPARARH